MAQHKAPTLVLAAAFLALVGCQSAPAVATATPTIAAQPPGQTLTLGEVSSDPASKAEQLSPFADYLAGQLADKGIAKGGVMVAADVKTMEEYLKTGKVDLYFENFELALYAHDAVGAQPLLRRWQNGVGEYHTNFVVRKDSGITTLDGLKGHLVAFNRSGSSTGDTLPRAYLLGQGYKLANLTDPTSPVDADKIGYVFAGSDANVVAWILQGKTVAAVMPSDNFDKLKADDKNQLVIVGKTPDFPRHIVLARPGLDPGLAAAIASVLTNMNQTSEGQAALKAYGNTAKFDSLPLGPEGTMDMIRKALQPVLAP